MIKSKYGLYSIFLFLFLSTFLYAQTSHEKVILPYDKGGPQFLNTAITGDTTATGARVDPDRVYVLKRDGIYLSNTLITNTGYKINIKAENGPGWKPFIYMDRNPTSLTIPGQFILIRSDINLKNIVISGCYEPVAANLGLLQGGLFNTGVAGMNIVIDSCILTNVNGNLIRTDQAPHMLKVTNTIFGNMGYLGTSNLGAGKAIDVRAGSVDSLIVQNCTFVNSQDRIIRHYQSTAPIKYLLFDHNTLVNGMGYHGVLSLGKVANDVNITNNLLFDAFALGSDTDKTRQAEFADSKELDQYGQPRMTWVIVAPDTVPATFNIKNNYYVISADGQAFYDKYKTAGVAEGSPLTWYVSKKLGADSTKAFTKVSLTLAKIPPLMTKFMEWYRSPTGGNKTKVTTNWNSTFDFNRVSADYLYDTLNCSYSKTSPAYTGGTDGKPVGAKNWSTTTDVEKISNVRVSSYSLEQNYPNPFNPVTTISYSVPMQSKVSLVIYNSLGQEIARLLDSQEQAQGKYNVTWNGKDLNGKMVSSGVYFYQLKTADMMMTKKMQMLK